MFKNLLAALGVAVFLSGCGQGAVDYKGDPVMAGDPLRKSEMEHKILQSVLANEWVSEPKWVGGIFNGAWRHPDLPDVVLYTTFHDKGVSVMLPEGQIIHIERDDRAVEIYEHFHGNSDAAIERQIIEVVNRL